MKSCCLFNSIIFHICYQIKRVHEHEIDPIDQKLIACLQQITGVYVYFRVGLRFTVSSQFSGE